MADSCIVCTFQKDCREAPILMYAADPLLRDIVSAHLEALAIPFTQEEGLFRMVSEPEQTALRLRERLFEVESGAIYVTRKAGPAIMAAPTLSQWKGTADYSWFHSALENDAFTTFFQPIFDTETQEVFGHECLIRLFADRLYGGGEILDAVIRSGNIHLFDSYARRLSIRNGSAQHLYGQKLFVNFMPSSIYDPEYCMRSTLDEMSRTELSPRDIVFEVVESDQIREVKHLQKICDYYRRENFGFALDDVGAGSNSFQLVCDMKPDYIKLDKSLISRIEEPMYYAAVGKLSEFAHQFGLGVISEGIETEEAAEKLRALGIRLMQGYHFGRPAALMKSSLASLVQLGYSVGSGQPIAETQGTAA